MGIYRECFPSRARRAWHMVSVLLGLYLSFQKPFTVTENSRNTDINVESKRANTEEFFHDIHKERILLLSTSLL